MLFFTLISCNHKEEKQRESIKNYKEPLMKANKNLLSTEDQRIEDFIKRYHWKMKTTDSGLRYFIYEHGTGVQAKEGETAFLQYSLTLLNNDTLYTSRKDGVKKFVIGKGEVIPGLQEAILLLKKGDRAKFIIPSHLAYGLVGDGSKIPAKATLVYDIKLIELK